MSRSLSLQDCYGPQALAHPDPLVRIAALHHAGPRLGGGPTLRQRLLGLLADADALVARYAALTLAQAGQSEGLQRLLADLASARGPERAALEACLRCCSGFPFAALLDGLLALEKLPTVKDPSVRTFLTGLLSLSAGRFQEAAHDAAWAESLVERLVKLDGVAGLPLKAGAFCDRGRVLVV